MTQAVKAFFALFASVGTLFCCALPATFVLLGAGATFASLTQSVPGLLWFGENKELMFILGGVGNGIGLYSLSYSNVTACEITDGQPTDCETTQNWSKPVLYISVGLYLIGLVFAYVLPWLMK
ncbi:MAG: hypothetical protein ACPGQS_04910 [Bradymonadia bacterium]